jgi:hypothetical protein
MHSIEQLLIDLDDAPWNAIFRVALGLAIVPAFHALAGNDGAAWVFPLLFIGLLIALRVVPAVLRQVLPFSAAAKRIWSDRRQIAKQHDSYQWQKLFWIGLGLLPYAVIGDGMRIGEIVVTTVCLVGGGIGLLLWRVNGAAHAAG